MAEVFQELAKILAAQTAAGQLATLEAIKELKKPSLKEQRENEEHEKKEIRIKENRLRQIEDTKKREAMREQMMAGCTHASYNRATGVSKHAWRAQVHAPDGHAPYFVPTCMINQCQLKDSKGELLKIPATTDMLQNGVNLDQYENLDVERLTAWYKQTTQQVA